MNIELVTGEIKKAGRRNRTPRIPHMVTVAPWAITPFMCHPVWPGETMKNLSYTAKVRSTKINTFHPIGGWWMEVFFYYVKHRDLAERELLTAMHVEGADIDDLITGADPKYYQGVDGVNWTKMCLEAVVQSDFRNKGEDLLVSTIDGYPAASINTSNWMDSLVLDSTGATDVGELQGQYTVRDPATDPANQAAYEHWERMRSVGLTTATWEDYIKSFGVRVASEKREELHVPELIKNMRIWDNPKWDTQRDGYAILGDLACTADKDRLFKEPGFILGFTVIRPKVYMTRQHSNACINMYTPASWLPAVLWDQPYTSLIQCGANEGPIGSDADPMDDPYWFDIRDIAVHGDQFLNFDPSLLLDATDGYSLGVALPATNTNRRFPSQADAERMFLARSPLGGYIDMEGLVSLTIASPIYDTTNGVPMGVHQSAAL